MLDWGVCRASPFHIIVRDNVQNGKPLKLIEKQVMKVVRQKIARDIDILAWLERWDDAFSVYCCNIARTTHCGAIFLLPLLKRSMVSSDSVCTFLDTLHMHGVVTPHGRGITGTIAIVPESDTA